MNLMIIVLSNCQILSLGVGPALSPERTRALLALRINVLSKGYSGISLRVLQQYIEAFNGKKVWLNWDSSMTV